MVSISIYLKSSTTPGTEDKVRDVYDVSDEAFLADPKEVQKKLLDAFLLKFDRKWSAKTKKEIVVDVPRIRRVREKIVLVKAWDAGRIAQLKQLRNTKTTWEKIGELLHTTASAARNKWQRTTGRRK